MNDEKRFAFPYLFTQIFFFFIRFISACVFFFYLLSFSTFFPFMHDFMLQCQIPSHILHTINETRNENVGGPIGIIASVVSSNILNPMSILSRFIFRLKITRMMNSKKKGKIKGGKKVFKSNGRR